MRRLGAGLVSLAGLAVLLVGWPAVLVWWAGWPLPGRLPTRADLQRWVTDPLTPQSVTGAAAVLLWLLWGWLAYTAAVEVVARLARIRLPRLRTGGPAQHLAGSMVGAVAVGLSTAASAAAAPPGTAAAPLAPADTDPGVGAGDVPRPGGPAAAPAKAADAGEDATAAGSGIRISDGGWMAVPVAVAVAAAVELLWMHRRRHYLPRPPTQAVRHDRDLRPPAGVVAVVLAALTRPQPSPIASAQADVAGGHRAVRPDGGWPVGVDLPAGGVGLVGPAAADAARGILTGLLLTRPGSVQVVTTAADWWALLGSPTGRPHRYAPGVIVVDNVDAALAHLEHHLLAHTAAAAPPPAAADASPPGQLVLLTSAPDPAGSARLAVALRLGRQLAVTGVVLGGWPYGSTWVVQPDGTTRPATGGTPVARVTVLSAAAAADVLDLADQIGLASAGVAATTPAAAPGSEHDPSGEGDTDPPAAPIRRPVLRLRLLGEVSLSTASEGWAEVVIQRTAAVQLLVLLAVHRPGLTRDEIMEAVWPDVALTAATRRLDTTLSALRTTLRSAASGDVVVRRGDRYRLDADHIDVDLWRLFTAVDRAATAIVRADRRRDLRAVVDGYAGELAADAAWPWLAPHREAVRRHAIDACTSLTDTETDPNAALAVLQEAIRIDPVNEDLHRRVMRQQAATADLDGVADTINALTERLAAIGAHTTPATRALADHLLHPHR